MTRTWKRARVFALLLSLAVCAVGVRILVISPQAGTAVETWIARQIVGVLESYTTTTVEFAALDYQAPGTVVATRFSMRLGTQDMITADRLLLELAEPPVPGRPIQVRRIELDAPRLYFVRSPGGGFVGWDRFLRHDRRADPRAGEPGRKLSDILVLRHVEINDGQLLYDAADGTEPMVLRGITSSLDTAPEDDRPEWHTLDGRIHHEPALTAELIGRIDLDARLLDVERLTLAVAMGPPQYEVFPPRLQSMLRKREVKGDLSARLEGTLPLRKWDTGRLTLHASLRDGRFALKDKVLPIDLLTLDGTLADSKVDAGCQARLLDGSLQADAHFALTPPRPLNLTWDIRGIRLERTLRVITQEPPRYAGTLRSDGRFAADLDRWPDAVDGRGTLHVDHGRLVLLPGMNELLRLVGQTLPAPRSKPNDRLDAKFEFTPRGVRVTEGELVSAYLAARMRGLVYYAGHMDLDVNAGPLEKVQSLLGRAGRIFGSLTDKVITYRVYGPITSPQVTIKPFAADMHPQHQ